MKQTQTTRVPLICVTAAVLLSDLYTVLALRLLPSDTVGGLWLLVHATAALLVLLGFAASKPAFQTARPLDRLIPLWLFLALLAIGQKLLMQSLLPSITAMGFRPVLWSASSFFAAAGCFACWLAVKRPVFLLAMALELLGGIGNCLRFLPLTEGSFLWIVVSAFALLNSFAFCPSLLALWRCKVRPKP